MGPLRRLLVRLALIALVGSSIIGISTEASYASASACPGGASAFPHDLLGGPVFNKAGDTVVATFDPYSDGDGKFCVMLQANKWRGTPHYMSIRLCKTWGDTSTCGAADAGNFSYYAGPVVRDFNQANHCYCAKVVVKRPNGTVAASGFHYIVSN